MKDKEWFLQFAQQLARQSPDVQQLFEQLVFGKSGLLLYRDNDTIPLTIYIYESVPEMLVLVLPDNSEEFFDLRNTIAEPQSFKHEISDLTLTKLSYVLLSNQRQESIILFKQPREKAIFIQFLNFYSKELMRQTSQVDTILLSVFTMIDTNYSFTLSHKELTSLLKFLKLSSKESLMNAVHFVKGDHSEREISYWQFQKIMQLMECRKELEGVFEDLVESKLKTLEAYTAKLLSKDSFQQFLIKVQNQLDQTRRDSIIKTIFNKDQRISFHQFCSFLYAGDNSAFDEKQEEEKVDFRQPLTSYYCLSSHNTYLTGNQLNSHSRPERYLQDLEAGYRCVEIDIHNGNHEPIVKHGLTLTKQVTFLEVIEAISKFSKSNPRHTPIILSLQNHADLEQQKKVAIILRRYFDKSLLLIEDFPKNEKEKKYPSLAECLGKIIIKNSGHYKYYKELNNLGASINDPFDQRDSEQQEDFDCYYGVQGTFTEIINYSQSIEEEIHKFDKETKEMVERKASFMKNLTFATKTFKNNFIAFKKEHKVHPEMINLTAMLGNGSIDHPRVWESISLSEGKINKQMVKFIKTSQSVIAARTSNYWVRSYPAGTRVDSSNYSPIPAMELGIQMIALNSQTVDHYTLLLQQFFRKGSKRCIGYRLKSAFPVEKNPISIKIKPISCSMISQNVKSENIPVVVLKLAFLGSAKDMTKNSNHTELLPYTESIKGNAYNPVFDNPRTMNLNVTQPFFAFLLIQIPECGMAVLALEGLRKGYRTVNLVDQYFRSKNSFVLFKVD